MSRRGYAATTLTREGKALVLLPDVEEAVAPHGVEPAWLEVFYNPRMEFNRDLSVAALAVYFEHLAPRVPDPCIAEPLTATGVRSIRYALELPVDACIVAGDIDRRAVELARDNAMVNGVGDRVRVYWSDARELIHKVRRLTGKPPLVVDLDPFGSPAPFLDAALSTLGHHGLLAMTATDLAVLEGSKPRALARRYMVSPGKPVESREVGLRILVGYAARIAAGYDKAVRPLLSYYSDHYYRVYLLVERGARRADRMLSECLSNAVYCPRLKRTLLNASTCPEPGEAQPIGPLWSCPLNDPVFVGLLREAIEGPYSYIGTKERAERLLKTLYGEAETGLEDHRLHVRIEALASYLHVSMPKVPRLLEELWNSGYMAVRSHYSPTSIRTNTPPSALARILLGLSRS